MKYYAYIKFLYDARCFIEHIFASLIRSLTDINFNEHYLISQRVLNAYVAAFTVSLVDRGFTIANDSIITNTSFLRLIPVSRNHNGKNFQRLLTEYKRIKETIETSTWFNEMRLWYKCSYDEISPERPFEECSLTLKPWLIVFYALHDEFQ